jgi:hypothetical protein
VSNGFPCANFQSSVGYTNPASFAANNGFAHTYVTSGGVAPFTYQWSNGATNDSISGLGVGSYCVTITDQIGCTEINCFTVNAPNQGNCQASFISVPDTANLGTFHFIGTSSPINATHFWNFGDGNFATGTPVSHTYTGAANSYTVTLTILDSANGCQSQAFDSVIIVGSNGSLVWPGDANSDGVADIIDILPIGIGFGSVGPTRANASLSWIGQ